MVYGESHRRLVSTPLALAAAALLAALALPRPAAASPYGVNIYAPQGAQLGFVLDQVHGAGMGWVRIDFVWANVETAPGVFDWSVYDALATAAMARGLNVYATLAYTPAWATHGPPTTGVPDDPATWADFCARAAQRYASSIQYWGLWNEPNLSKFWSGTSQQYINDILIPGADAIHGANAAAKVGGPELAHVSSSQWYYWLRDCLNQAAGHLDFVTHHVYDIDGNAAVTNRLTGSTPFGGDPALWTVIDPSVKEVLKSTGWWGRPVWLTETGWQSVEVSEATQAAYYTGLLNDWFTGQSGQSWVAQLFFYEIEDAPGSPTSWGILHVDGSPKPAYVAYENFITTHTFHPTDDAQLVASNLPTSMETGQTITVRVTFQNTGASTWTEAAEYRLGAADDQDPLAPNRQLLAPGVSIAPGQQVTFSFALTAPANPGTYHTQWQMLKEGVDRFGGIAAQDVVVTAAPPPAQRDLALLSGQFSVEVSWHDPLSGHAGFARQVAGSDQTGFFWFFDHSNLELMVKALDGRGLNSHYWFFYGALSSVEYWITVRDLKSGAVRTYYNAPGNICGGADTAAFPPPSGHAAAGDAATATAESAPTTEPAGAAAPCARRPARPMGGGRAGGRRDRCGWHDRHCRQCRRLRLLHARSADPLPARVALPGAGALERAERRQCRDRGERGQSDRRLLVLRPRQPRVAGQGDRRPRPDRAFLVLLRRPLGRRVLGAGDRHRDRSVEALPQPPRQHLRRRRHLRPGLSLPRGPGL